MFSNPASQPGDIIFFRPGSKKSGNIVAQTLIRRRTAMHSHVAIAVKQGNAIHAMPHKGVHVVRIRDLLIEKGDNFQVYRNIAVSGKQDLLGKLEDALWYFNRQKYNIRFFMPSRSNASFCSELAAKSYEKISIKVSTKPASSTLPVDIFEEISKNKKWEDVTCLYRAFFLDEDFDHGHNLASDFVNTLEQMNQDMATGQQRLIDRINMIQRGQGQPNSSIRPSRSYWHIDPRRHSRRFFRVNLRNWKRFWRD